MKNMMLLSASAIFLGNMTAFAFDSGTYKLTKHNTISSKPFGNDTCPKVIKVEDSGDKKRPAISVSRATDSQYSSNSQDFVTLVKANDYEKGKTCITDHDVNVGQVYCSRTTESNEVITIEACTTALSSWFCILGNLSTEKVQQLSTDEITYSATLKGNYGAQFVCTYKKAE